MFRNLLVYGLARLIAWSEAARRRGRAALSAYDALALTSPAIGWIARYDWSPRAHHGAHRQATRTDQEPLSMGLGSTELDAWQGADEDWHPADEIRAAAPSQPEETLMERRDREAAEIQRQRQLAEQAEAERTAEIHAALPERQETDAALARLDAVARAAIDTIVTKWGISADDIRAYAREVRRKTVDSNTAELRTLQVLGDMVRPHLHAAAVAATA